MLNDTTKSGVTERLEAIRVALAGMCRDLEPDHLSAAEAAATHESLMAITKLADGALVRLARRIDKARVWQSCGDPSAAEFLARTAGTSRRQAREVLDTSWRLARLAATDEAVRAGRLSPDQASAVSDGAQADRDAEVQLLAAAAHQPVSELRNQVRRVKAAADPDAAATARRLHRERRLWRWTDADGAYNLEVRTTAAQGAVIDAALQPATDEVFTRHAARHAAPENASGWRRTPWTRSSLW